MTATTIRVQMAQRKDTAANWTAANPILLSGEIGYETDTKKFKIGDGTTNWNSLAYLPIPDGSGNLTITGNLEIGNTGSLTFEGSTADGFETTLAVTNPTADRTITLPNQSGTVLVSGNASIVDADISATAEIAVSKLADGAARQLLQTDAAGTGVEWASNIDIPGTLDVTGAATFDAAVSVALGSAASPSLTFTGDANSGLYSPGADQVAISTGGSGRLFVDSSGRIGVGVSSPGDIAAGYATLQIGGTNGGGVRVGTSSAVAGYIAGSASGVEIGTTGTTALNFFTNNQTRATITSAGLVGVGTSSPSDKFEIANGTTDAANALGIRSGRYLNAGQEGAQLKYYSDNTSSWLGTREVARIGAYGLNSDHRIGSLAFAIKTTNSASDPTEMMRLTPTGLGVGTTSPSTNLHVVGGGAGVDAEARISSNQNGAFLSFTPAGANAIRHYAIGSAVGGSLIFYDNTAATQRAAIDSSGRLLVGTSSARSTFYNGGTPTELQVEGDGEISVTRNLNDEFGGSIILGKSRSAANTLLSSGDIIGNLSWQGNDGTDFVEAARISAVIDGTPGANDMPGRLVFSTAADGASSPTEAMRINSEGSIFFGTTTLNPGLGNSAPGVIIRGNAGGAGNYLVTARNSNSALYVARNVDDGSLVEFYQGGTLEGTISVSGTTVSYNGAHLSRWSQLSSGAERTEILRGSVLSNLDEMCEWVEEDNEQLNRMKVSDVEGDKNVSGVFQAWDDDDDTYTNDFYCAMTGDFIIRIGAGVTVQRGDLLMSAGDGTAKPQDDDIIRSKTIAKVTSTNVSCTYADGSYCVPCALMAC